MTLIKTAFLKISYWIPPVLWAYLMFQASDGPVPSITQDYWVDFVIKSMAHVLEYAILASLVYRALINSYFKASRAYYLAFIICILYAFTDEYHQSWIPSRDARFHDIIFDTIGTSLALYTLWKLLPKIPNKLKNLAKNLQMI